MALILLSILNLKMHEKSEPMPAYLSILVLEIVCACVKKNKNIKGLNMFNHTFLYTANTNDMKFFFLKDKGSLIFSSFSGLKPSKGKCALVGTGTLKRAKCIDLRLSTIIIWGIHFSYNKKIENFLKHITSTGQVLKLWRMLNLALEGKILVFKALSMVDIALITNIPTSIMKELSKIQKEYIWKNKNCCLHLTSSPVLPSAMA